MSQQAEIVDYGERRARGRQLYEEIMWEPAPTITSPRVESLIDYVFAEIWARPGMDRRSRRLVTITCLAGTDSMKSLRQHMYAALASGDLTYEELQLAAVQYAVYLGFGRAETFCEVLDEQWERLHVERGEPVPVRAEEPLTPIAADQEERKQYGEEQFLVVNCVPAPPRGFAYYEAGNIAYVFGDMWHREGLSRRDRRWVTVACVGLSDAVAPIQAHVYSAMKSGDIAYEEMDETVLQFAAYAGWPKASYLQQVVIESKVRIDQEAIDEEAAG